MREKVILRMFIIALFLGIGTTGFTGCNADVPEYASATDTTHIPETVINTQSPPSVVEEETEYADELREEPIAPPPAEPSFEVMYEIETRSGWFLFSDEPINSDEIEWGRFRPHEHPFFPAGTAVAFMPRHGRTLRHLELIGQIWYEGNISSLGVERFGYEIRLPEVMFGTDQNVRIHPPRFYESIRVGILLPVPEIDDREYPILPTHLRFEIGSKVYIHNGVQKQLNTAPFINEETGHVMLPVLVITEALGYFHDVVHVFDNQYFALVLNRTGDSEFYIRDIDEPRRGINNIVTVNGCLFAALQGVALISSQHEYIRRDGNFIDVWASREDAAVWLEAQN